MSSSLRIETARPHHAAVLLSLVRDLARQLGKQAQLEIVGANTDVDREILDRLEAPLNHAIRNSVDHGIERPEEPHAANALALGGTVIFPTSFPRTRARLEARGFSVAPLDISELQKAESGLTCSSLLFDVRHP